VQHLQKNIKTTKSGLNSMYEIFTAAVRLWNSRSIRGLFLHAKKINVLEDILITLVLLLCADRCQNKYNCNQCIQSEVSSIYCNVTRRKQDF